MRSQSEDHGPRISKLEGAVQGIGTQIENLVKHQDERDRAQSKRDEILFKKLEEARDLTRPNMATYAAWATVAVALVLGVYMPFSAGLNDRVTAATKQSELADKLQQAEMDNLTHRFQRLSDWQDDRVKADLEELRCRRLAAIGIK